MRSGKPERKHLFAANWKMHKSVEEALSFVDKFLAASASLTIETVLFPSMTSLPAVIVACRGSNLRVGAQNMHWLNSGAFTGETSPGMLVALGCTHVLIGHSERRQYFNETDETVNLKVKSALGHGLTPVVCVGEQESARDGGKTEEVLNRQVTAALCGIDPAAAAGLVLAYEPIWAIGTGKTATPAIAERAHKVIRQIVASALGARLAEQTRILYGGSVKPDNASSLRGLEDVDGALVGGASLEAELFLEIIQNAGLARSSRSAR
jgi:triosephosphate isomerase (TIM)